MHARDSRSSFTSPANVKSVHSAEITSGASEAALPRLGYSVAEASKITSISKSKLWELIRSGTLRSVKVARRRLSTHAASIALLNGEGA